MGTEHSHGAGANERALRWALAFTGGFMLAEVAGSFLTGSLALLSDAAHMFTDTTALAVSLAAPPTAGGPGATTASRSWRRPSTPRCCSWSRSTSSGRRGSASAPRPRCRASACWRLPPSGWR